jgi:hypothetical protein
MIGIRKTLFRASLHADILAWKARVFAAGGNISSKVLFHTSLLTKWCYAVGLRDPTGANHKIKFWLPLATQDFNGLFIPIWHPTSNATCINNNFIGTDYSLLLGLKGNGATKCIDSLVNTNIFAGNSIYLAGYSRTDSQSVSYIAGAGNPSINGSSSSLAPRWSDGACYFEHTIVDTLAASVSDSLGLFSATRFGGNNCLFKNAVQVATNSTADGPVLPSINYYLFAYNNSNSGTDSFSARQLSSFMIGSNVTQALAQSLAQKLIFFESNSRS